MTKKYFLLAAFLILGLFAKAQTGGFHYKFILTDNDLPLSNATVNVKFTLKNGSEIVWEEEHTGVVTDENGMGMCYMGEGTRLSGTATDFDDIPWNASLTYDVDIDEGSGYQNYVTDQPFKFVPSAKFALSADYENLFNKPEVFYQSGTVTPATTADQNIYRTGALYIGQDYDLENTKLYVFADTTLALTGQKIVVDSETGDTNPKTGLYALVTGAGEGYLTGIISSVNASGDGVNVGYKSLLSGSGSGSHVAWYANLSGSGAGYQTGEYTIIQTSGDGFNIGNYYDMMGSGNGIHVGAFASLTGTGSGDKYGFYASISEDAGGTHYGIYSSVPKAGSYAGYFEGNTFMSGKLLSGDSGDADLKAYVYGSILGDGTVETTASSEGFSVTRNGAGDYTVSFSNSPGNASIYMVNATLQDNTAPGFISVERNANGFTVKTYDITGTPADMNFSFVVYKK